MVGKTNVAGARLRSVIAVTYPSGSVCTCVSGAKSLKAKDTGGRALFNVQPGDWTVSCTDGSSTASQEISITAEGQIGNVELSYGLVLFDKDAGIDRTDLTGGFALYDGYVGFSQSTDSTGGYGIMSANKVADIANYSTLIVETGDITAPQGAYMGIASNATSNPKIVYSNMTSKVSVDSNGQYALDISGVTSSAYIALCCYNDGSSTRSFVMRAKRITLQ